jgi:flagellar operon protein (TIGR03826 family)
MMQAGNCPRCGKVFVRIREPICEKCIKEEEENFEKVRTYLKEYPNRSIHDVSLETEVPVKRILKYIQEGRIEATQGMADDVRCGKCGKPLVKGRMCEACAVELNKQVVEMKHEANERFTVKGKVYTSDGNR